MSVHLDIGEPEEEIGGAPGVLFGGSGEPDPLLDSWSNNDDSIYGRHPDTNRCSDLDQSMWAKGMQCGAPLSAPCFRACSSSHHGIYVFDAECSLRDAAEQRAVDAESAVESVEVYRSSSSSTRMKDVAYLARIMRDAAEDAGMLAESYWSACLFVHVDAGNNGSETPCAASQPLWGGGANHLLINLTDRGREYRPLVADSYAMEAASNMHTCYFREGYDISVPLAPLRVFHELADLAPLDREFFLTTKGTLYLGSSGSEERFSLLPLDDEDNGVIISLTCLRSHGEHLLPENVDLCQALENRYHDYDYDSLMNTTFGLVPGGRSPGTFRLGEVMSTGAIPVFVGRDLVLPFQDQLDWPSFSFSFPPDHVEAQMISTLRAVPQAELESMQMLELLESATATEPLVSTAALLCRVEGLLLSGTGATSVNAFLVDHWFNKLLHFSPASCSNDDGERQGAQEAAGASGAPCADGGRGGESQGHQTQTQQQHQRQDEIVFDTRAVCDIGEGIVGMAAKTGRKLRIRDCSTQYQRRRENPSCSTDYNSGGLVCWPVRKRARCPGAMATGMGAISTSAELEDVDSSDGLAPELQPDSAGLVLAVLQVHCADGGLSAETVEVLCSVGRVLVPLLTETLARDKEYVRRRSTEALLSLSNISPKDMGLIAMVEEVVRVAQVLMEAERVCLFFVDDAADELWVASSVGYDARNAKIGECLCGQAAATGEILNVIDSSDDDEFDRRRNKQSGSLTKSLLCVPIPPPDHALSGVSRARRGCRGGGAARRVHQHRPNEQDSGDNPHEGRTTPSYNNADAKTRVSLVAEEQQSVGPVSGLSPTTLRKGSFSARAAVGRTSSRVWFSDMPARPLAVFKVSNRRGGKIFNEHEEDALVRLCARIEVLLREKAAEMALLWSGMAERSMVRESNNRGGAGGARINYARVQSTIMQLYSGATFPTEAVKKRERLTRPRRSKSFSILDLDVDASQAGAISDVDASQAGAISDVDASQAGAISGSDERPHRNGSAVSGRMKVAGGLEGSSSDSGSGEVKGVDRIPGDESAQAESCLVDLSMNLFDLSSEQLLSLAGRFFRSMRLIEMFQISDEKMRSFLRGVEQRYQPKPFHNLAHAVSVTHVSFTIVKTSRADTLLRPLDKLALLVAALCHDIDHPGNNNAYEVNSMSSLALLYGDSSVLERHHVFVTYQVLLEQGGASNIFSGLTRAQFRDVRHTIVQAILGTDMSVHMQHCAEVFQFAQKAKKLAAGRDRGGPEASSMQAHAPPGVVDTDPVVMTRQQLEPPASGTPGYAGGEEGEKPSDHVFSVDKAEDRLFLTRTILHCADLSGQVLNNALALEWGRRILDEFRLQARLEANTGLPRTTVANGDPETTTKGQHFFVEKVVKPLWEPFVGLFPELKPLLNSLNQNGHYYLREGLRLEKQRLAAASTASDVRSPRHRGQEEGGRGKHGDGGSGGGNGDQPSASTATNPHGTGT